MNFVEDLQLQLNDSQTTKDGYLVSTAKCARTGVQHYRGFEVGERDKDIVAVYRPEEEVFDKASLTSFAYKPITVDHPSEPVTAENWNKHSKGFLGGDVARDGDWVIVHPMLMDGAAIEALKSGKKQVSMGYMATLDWTPGVTPDGLPYDAVQRDLSMNHLAMVDAARAGNEAMIADSTDAKNWGVSPTQIKDNDAMKESVEKKDINKQNINKDKQFNMETEKFTIDGITIEVSKQAKEALDKLQGLNDSLQKKLGDKDTEIANKDKDLAGKDAALAAKDAEIKETKDLILSDEEINKRVVERSGLIAEVSKVVKDQDFSDKSNFEIKCLMVDAIHGEGTSKDKSEAYIDAAFDFARKEVAKKAKADPVAGVLKDKKVNEPVKDNGQSAYNDRIANAWKGVQKSLN